MLVTVDTGGTKTLVASFSEEGTLAESEKFPTPPAQNEYITQLIEKLTTIHQKTPIDSIVIASPGVVKDNIIIWGGGNLTWHDFDIPTALAPHFPSIPVLVQNDANLGGLGETRLLQTLPDVSLYTTISTGIGTGVTIDGLISELHSESGHLLLEFDGVVQEWEDFASGKAIYETYGKYGKDITDIQTWHQIADRISRGFLVLIPVLQPDIIILGGSMGSYFEKYADDLTGILKEKLPQHIPCPLIVKAKHAEEAVLYGCYFYALDTLTPHNA